MKKLDQQAIDALKRPDTRVVAMEFTEEQKTRFKLVSDQIIALLKQNTKGPIEAYALLVFIVKGFEHTFDIRGSTMLEKGDGDKGE